MGYRGSKSIVSLNKIKNTFVKEQRVDGSYFGSKLNLRLRCTLMGCESSHQISNPSKQFIIQTRNFHSHSKKLVHQTFTTKTQAPPAPPFGCKAGEKGDYIVTY
jgi:hypothetical protein